MNDNRDVSKGSNKDRSESIMSLRARDGTMLEAVLRADHGESRLVSFRDGEMAEHRSVSIDGRRSVPYSPTNNLLTHRVVLLPSAARNYESEALLLDEVQRFIHRYHERVTARVTNDVTATPRATLTHGLTSTSGGSASVPGCGVIVCGGGLTGST